MMDQDLLSKIKTLRSVAWEGHADVPSLEAWLENFKAGEERKLALHMLSRFVYFGSDQVRLLLKALYRDKFKIPLVQKIKTSLGTTAKLEDVEKVFHAELSGTRFMGVGLSLIHI